MPSQRGNQGVFFSFKSKRGYVLLEQVELDFATESVMMPQLARDFMIFIILGEEPLVFLEACTAGFMQNYNGQFGRKIKVSDL